MIAKKTWKTHPLMVVSAWKFPEWCWWNRGMWSGSYLCGASRSGSLWLWLGSHLTESTSCLLRSVHAGLNNSLHGTRSTKQRLPLALGCWAGSTFVNYWQTGWGIGGQWLLWLQLPVSPCVTVNMRIWKVALSSIRKGGWTVSKCGMAFESCWQRQTSAIS